MKCVYIVSTSHTKILMPSVRIELTTFCFYGIFTKQTQLPLCEEGFTCPVGREQPFRAELDSALGFISSWVGKN